jgi:hypothetical protein
VKERIAGGSSVRVAADRKADAKDSAVELSRPVDRENLDLGHWVVAVAAPYLRYAENDWRLDPLPAINLAAADVFKLHVQRAIEILIGRAESLPGNKNPNRPGIDLE